MRTTFWGLLTLAVLCGRADAGLIPGAVTVVPGSGYYQFKYNVSLPSDYKVKSGDFFTIYDFHGYVAGHDAQPAGWTFSTGMTGPNPPGIAPSDSGGVVNLTWTYSGPDLTTPGSLGVFEAASSFGKTGDVQFASRDHRMLDGRAVGNYTLTDGPDPTRPSAPEPATLLMIALGLPLVGVWFARGRAT